MPELCDERSLDLTGPSSKCTILESTENFDARQSTNSQPQASNPSPEIGYGADHLCGDESGASEYSRSAYATVLKTTGSETVATGGCGEAWTIPSTQEQAQSFMPDPANHVTPEQQCACMSCLKVCSNVWFWDQNHKCRFPGCQTSTYLVCLKPEKSHYGQSGKYACLEQNCQAVTKNFGDLKRHDKAKHCTKPDKEQFPCPVIWCKYSGNNGFARKDKLKSHYKNIHEGKPGPVKTGRVIKPATLKPKVPGLGGSASK